MVMKGCLMLCKKVLAILFLLGSCVSYSSWTYYKFASKKPSYLDSFKSAFREAVERDQDELDQRFLVWGESQSRRLQKDPAVRSFLQEAAGDKGFFISGKKFTQK